jgi:hypothetical protein
VKLLGRQVDEAAHLRRDELPVRVYGIDWHLGRTEIRQDGQQATRLEFFRHSKPIKLGSEIKPWPSIAACPCRKESIR